jgi:hypothetical protein
MMTNLQVKQPVFTFGFLALFLITTAIFIESSCLFEWRVSETTQPFNK